MTVLLLEGYQPTKNATVNRALPDMYTPPPQRQSSYITTINYLVMLKVTCFYIMHAQINIKVGVIFSV